MSKKDKLLRRFLSMLNDFHYDKLVALLNYFGFHEVPKGKTSSSRVKFENAETFSIMLHRPHPNGIMKRYQLKQIKEILEI